MEEKEIKPRTGFAKFEQRKNPRFLLNLPIEYYRINIQILNQVGHTVNASEDGIAVYLPEKFEIGQHLRLKIYFSAGLDVNAVEILAQVVWRGRDSREDGDYKTGLVFVDISSEDRRRLNIFLNALSQ